MKRSLTLLLASLFLVFSLTACGRSNQNSNDQNGNATTNGTAGTNETYGAGENANNGTANNGTTNNETANNGTDNHNGGLIDDTGDVLEDIGNGTRDVLDDSGRALTGNNGTVNRSANGAY